MKLLLEIIEQQKPSISSNELVKIFESKRDSIRDVVYKYKVLEQNFGKSGSKTSEVVEEREYGYKSGKFLVEKAFLSPESDEKSRRLSYDGESIIELRVLTSLPLQAGVRPAKNLTAFFDVNLPIISSGLFDTNSYNFPHFSLDVVLFLKGRSGFAAPIFEKIETIDGNRCVVASVEMLSVYFSLDHNYSIVQRCGYSPIFNGNKVAVDRYLDMKQTMHDLKSYGNGIWLPEKIVTEFYDEDGNVRKKYIVDASLVTINGGLDDSYFTNFIPKDTFVSDTIRGMVYKWGDRTSIDGILKDTVKSKRVMIFRYISVTLGLIMIATWCVLKYREYLNKRAST